MASNREERRLGRQRGAAKHQVQDVDFGTPFQIAPVAQQRTTRSGSTHKQYDSREGRRLGRQRGAVKHQVQDVEFKTPFQTAPVLPKSTNRSGVRPQQESSQARRTPNKGPGEYANGSSTQKRKTPTPAHHAIDANIKAKRMKLVATQEHPTSSPTRRTRSKMASRGDFDQLAEEDPQLESGLSASQSLRPSRVTDGALLEEKEITKRPQNTPASGQRRQASIQPMKAARNGTLGASGELGPSGRIFKPNGAQTIFGAGSRRSVGLPFDRTSKNTRILHEADLVDELSPERIAASYLVRDKGQFAGDKDQEESDFDATAIVEVAQNIVGQIRQPEKDVSVGEAEGMEHEHDEPQRDQELGDDLHNRRTKQRVTGKKARAKTSPATQRQPKKPKPKPPKGKPAARPRETIPVVVHRLTKPIHHRDDGTDADLLNEAVPFAKRSGVNAVDVLSQFCEEIIESGLVALDEGGSTAEDSVTRREYRTKLRAVEAFQEELRTRLLELTITLDTSYSLNRRVCAAQKKKNQLRDDLLYLRARRELIALQMDEVRIKHERDSKAAQDQQVLNTNLHDIEFAVSWALEHAPGGEEPALQPPDLATLLGALANGVSSRSKERGILRRVIDFNALLERAAVSLESKDT